MQKPWKVLSTAALVAALSVSMVLPAFAADGDITDMSTGTVYQAATYNSDTSAYNTLVNSLIGEKTSNQFAYSFGGKQYGFDSFSTAVTNLLATPGETPTQAKTTAATMVTPISTTTVSSVSAVNGTVTVNMSAAVPSATISNFTVTQAIGGATATTITPSVISVNGSVVTLTVPAVVATAAVQSVVVGVSYNGATAVNASAYTVAALPSVTATSITNVSSTGFGIAFGSTSNLVGLPTTITLTPASGTTVTGTVVYDNNSKTASVVAALAPNVVYTPTITGVSFGSLNVAVVVATATGITNPTIAGFGVTFSSSANLSGLPNVITLTPTSGTPVSGTIVYDNTAKTALIAANLATGTVYTPSVTGINFGSLTITVPATVVATATGIITPSTTGFGITFSSTSNLSNLSGTINLTTATGTVVTGTVGYDNTAKTASVVASLQAGTTYTPTIPGVNFGAYTVAIAASGVTAINPTSSTTVEATVSGLASGATLAASDFVFNNGLTTSGTPTLKGGTNNVYVLTTSAQTPNVIYNLTSFRGTAISGNTAANTFTGFGSTQPIIMTVGAVSNLNVANGTLLANAGLPSSVTVNLSNGTSQSATVTWDTTSTPAYNATTAGTYVVGGTVTAPSGTSNPNNVRASVQVVVAAPAANTINGIVMGGATDGSTIIIGLTTYNVDDSSVKAYLSTAGTRAGILYGSATIQLNANGRVSGISNIVLPGSAITAANFNEVAGNTVGLAGLTIVGQSGTNVATGATMVGSNMTYQNITFNGTLAPSGNNITITTSNVQGAATLSGNSITLQSVDIVGNSTSSGSRLNYTGGTLSGTFGVTGANSNLTNLTFGGIPTINADSITVTGGKTSSGIDFTLGASATTFQLSGVTINNNLVGNAGATGGKISNMTIIGAFAIVPPQLTMTNVSINGAVGATTFGGNSTFSSVLFKSTLDTGNTYNTYTNCTITGIVGGGTPLIVTNNTFNACTFNAAVTLGNSTSANFNDTLFKDNLTLGSAGATLNRSTFSGIAAQTITDGGFAATWNGITDNGAGLSMTTAAVQTLKGNIIGNTNTGITTLFTLGASNQLVYSDNVSLSNVKIALATFTNTVTGNNVTYNAVVFTATGDAAAIAISGSDFTFNGKTWPTVDIPRYADVTVTGPRAKFNNGVFNTRLLLNAGANNATLTGTTFNNAAAAGDTNGVSGITIAAGVTGVVLNNATFSNTVAANAITNTINENTTWNNTTFIQSGAGIATVATTTVAGSKTLTLNTDTDAAGTAWVGTVVRQ